MDKVAVAFFGSSKFCLRYLDFLYKNPLYNLVLVVSQPDKPSGRGFQVKPTATKLWAQKNGILSLTPVKTEDPLFVGALKTLPLNLGLAAYYGLKISKTVIERFPLGILNVHHSLLPKHRGPNPIPWTILSGESKTGTSLMEIDERFDTGPIVARVEEEVSPTDTTQSLRERLDAKAIDLLEEVLPRFVKGELEAEKTVTELGTYEPKITKEMGKIDWQQTEAEIERKIRAFNPWPGCWTMLSELLSKLKVSAQGGSASGGESSKLKVKEKRVKILKARLDKEGKLIIEELQIEGKRPTNWPEFLAGYVNS